MSNEAIVLTGDGIEFFRLLSLKGRLKLEVQTGMNFRMSCTQTIRDIIGSKTRSKKKLLAEYEDWMIAKGFDITKTEVTSNVYKGQ